MKKRGFFYELNKNKVLFIMILPVLAYFTIFSYLPMVGVYYAFTQFDFNGGLFGSPFIGFKNFQFLFTGGKDAVIWVLTRNTILYNVAFILIGNTLQIVTAIFLSELPGKVIKRTAQSIIFLPYFLSFVLIGVFVYNIFNFEYGLFNSMLKMFNRTPIDFYDMPGAWKYILITANVWKGIGYGTVVYLAAIMGIDRSMYEAADIDGANVFQKIKFITLPHLKPTFILLILFSLGSILKGQFDLFYQVIGNNGTLFPATDIIDTYVYRALTVNFDIGLGTAAGLYQSFFGMMLILTVNAIIRKVNAEYALF